MKIAIILSFLILASCGSNSYDDKEKELLEKELALTKKELELTKRQDSISSQNDQILSNNKDLEILVFSTDMLSKPKTAIINGKEYSIKIKKSVIETEDPPFETQTTLMFASSEIPNLSIESDVVSFAVRDVNNDGKEEIVVCTMGNGTWASIEVYSLTNKMKWKSPIKSFMWWTGEEGCDAKMFWTQSKNQMRITTTNSASENFECNDETKVVWK